MMTITKDKICVFKPSSHGQSLLRMVEQDLPKPFDVWQLSPCPTPTLHYSHWQQISKKMGDLDEVLVDKYDVHKLQRAAINNNDIWL